jgi:hypothetical protein
MPRDADTVFNRYYLLFVIIICSMSAGACIAREEWWNAIGAGAITTLAGAVLGSWMGKKGD